MKRILLSLLIVAISIPAMAQITITEDDIAPISSLIVNANIDAPVGYTPGESGENRHWDFSGFTFDSFDSLWFAHPSWTPDPNAFPTSNFVVALIESGDTAWAYMEKNTDKLAIIGLAGEFEDQGFFFVDVVPEEIFADFPVNYGDTRTESFYGQVELESTEPFVDSIRFKMATEKTMEVDAWGNMQMPTGDYEVLRMRENRIQYDSIWAKTFGIWVLIDAGQDESKTYSWMSDADDTGYILASMSVTPETDSVEGISWLYQSILSTPEIPIVYNELNVYPNPVIDEITIPLNNAIEGEVHIYSLNGKLIQKEALQPTINVAILESGFYLYRIITKEGKNYHGKFLKK